MLYRINWKFNLLCDWTNNAGELDCCAGAEM